LADIVRAVSEQTGIKTTDIYGRCRTAPVAQARQLVMYLCERQGMTSHATARLLGRDRSTVSDGIRAEKTRRGEL
jgi:chromosomal replication initiation ATPase DnaA